MSGIALWLFSNLGLLVLLFMVGLESSVGEMRELGARSVLVALTGVAGPLGLGYAALWWLLPEAPHAVHIFVAATLCATSVGIAAPVLKDLGKVVLKDLGKVKTPEALIVLGAAVIDDVLGLILLAAVVGVMVTGAFQLGEFLRISLTALAFLGVLLVVGDRAMDWRIRLFRSLDRHGYKLVYAVVLMLTMAWLANLVGLAAIVGAFAAACC